MNKPDKKNTGGSAADKQRILGLAGAGRLAEAKQSCEQYCRRFPGDPEGLMYLGAIDGQMGLFAEAEQCMRKVLALQPGNAPAYYNLGLALSEQNKTMAAIAAFEDALRIQPDYTDARGNLNKLYSSIVPRWHFPMMNDEGRNSAYDQAIRRAVRPDDVVLDIGSGSGLLAMMAARAGAKTIVSCEVVRPVAEKAREIVRANGFEDRIKIIGKRSTNLKVGEDLPQRASLLISEILDVGVLGEGVVPSVEHARANLLTPDARMIPRGATVFAVLVESEKLHQDNYVSTASGFDVSAFNDFSSHRYLQLNVTHYPHRRLTDVFEVFDFDFTDGSIRPTRKTLQVSTIEGGMCHAVVFWFRLYLDDEVSLETSPEVEGCWVQAIQIFKQPVSLPAGATLDLGVGHNGSTIVFDMPRASGASG